MMLAAHRSRLYVSSRHSITGLRKYSATSEYKKLQRSLLYVPASNDRMLQKSLTSESDALIYDLEDSVAPNEKARARSSLLEFLRVQDEKHAQRSFVRLNAIDTPQFKDDITTMLQFSGLQGIVMPKIHSAEHLDEIASYVPQGRPLSIIASIESARGLWDAGRIAGWKATKSGAGDQVFVSSLLFAAEDYCADTSIIRTRSREELLYPRSQMATAAKAFGLKCIDMVCVNYKEEDILREECEEARRLGYDGKQAIHPNQVQIIQSTFVPTEKEILRAAKIVNQMKKSHASSVGAFGLDSGDGKGAEMIDAPMLKQAEATIAKATAAGLKIPDL